jgi:hypothetical protein
MRHGGNLQHPGGPDTLLKRVGNQPEKTASRDHSQVAEDKSSLSRTGCEQYLVF